MMGNAKRKIFLSSFTALVFAIYLLPLNGFAQPLSSRDLINNAKQYDGKIVVYAGEAVGEVMQRGDYAWVNLNDGANAIGIWLERKFTKEIVYTGSYKSKGDWLEVSGVFHRACPQHGGDLDIHAQSLNKKSSGRLIEEHLNTAKRNQAAILLGLLILIWIFSRLKQK